MKKRDSQDPTIDLFPFPSFSLFHIIYQLFINTKPSSFFLIFKSLNPSIHTHEIINTIILHPYQYGKKSETGS